MVFNQAFNEKYNKLRVTHGRSRTWIYYVYHDMLRRCNTPHRQSWGRYGGRGIKVCKEWLTFEGFYADMGDPPNTREFTLERKNLNRGYSKSNCVWAKRTRQNRNHTMCKLDWHKVDAIRQLYRYGGMSMKALGDRYGVNASNVHRIVHEQMWHPSTRLD